MNPGNFLSKLIHFCSLGIVKPNWFFSEISENPKWSHCLGFKKCKLQFPCPFLPVSQTSYISVVTARCEICRIYSNRTFSSPTKRLVRERKTFFMLWCCHFFILLTDWTLFRLLIIDYWVLHVTRYDEVTITSYIRQFHPLWHILPSI